MVAVSGRALAAAAGRAGYAPAVIDLFGDRDTRALAPGGVAVAGSLARGFGRHALLAAAETLAPTGGLVYGAGFEARPGLLAALAHGRRLLGNTPETLSRIKDPAAFFTLLDRLGIPHPAVALRRPAAPAGWLAKRVGGAGGVHVRPAEAASGTGPLRRSASEASRRYYQRRVEGRAVGALFLADGRRARLLGLSEQWPAPDGAARPYRFGGAARPAAIGRRAAREIAAAIGALVRDTGLVGLNSLDMMVDGDDFLVLEVNPRPGATIDIFDAAPGLFGLHVAACAGRLKRGWRAPAGAAASAIAYADRPLRIGAAVRWPRWSADRPAAGSRIAPGEPVCTVLVRARSATAARARAGERVAAVLAALGGDAARPRSKELDSCAHP
ncbi:MAG: ATP-grasp domain-containing protein [Dongiaceae bacterium]